MEVRTRMARRLGPATGWSSFVFIGGMLLDIPILMGLGALMLAAMTLFAIVTLPVERNASDRALRMLEQSGLAHEEERAGVRSVLRAAALTYAANVGRRLTNFVAFVMVVGLAGLAI